MALKDTALAHLAEEITRAADRLSTLSEEAIRRTPLDESFALSAAVRGSGSAGGVWLKLESEQVRWRDRAGPGASWGHAPWMPPLRQVTGSFKARGAVNKICSLVERGWKSGA